MTTQKKNLPPICVRYSKTEKSRLLALVAEAGLSTSEYIRHRTLNQPLPPVVTDVAIETYWELGKISKKLEQETKRLDYAVAKGEPCELSPELIEELQTVLRQIRAEIAGIKSTINS